ncbi:DnaJ domain-containing protein [Marinobacterium arenosum]|uniref:DnaJ domain-containing protein n=1 Tax=Marinobacterium arenosum TaxID=2862496 RepID=UPI001C9869AC|nr:DnaJ domain-containing protein [Marinobacterium arenosum]MBY4678495.1 DnaJ domain-containing protein [Marinobacterium arenosum]
MHPLGLILLGTITLLGMLWLRSQPRKQRRAASLKLIMILLMLGLLYLAITGRLHWLGALVAALLPFTRRLLPLLRYLPLVGNLYRQHQQQKQYQQQAGGNRSEIQTRILQMTLDHDSGVMYGLITEGPLRGRELGELEEQEFLQLLHYCRQRDEESTRVLEAYLDKRFGDRWRADDHQSQQPPNDHGSSEMTREDAYQILGLEPGADHDAIVAAHRRLMQKVHPDRGGSHYLAARINEAKDLLLKS